MSDYIYKDSGVAWIGKIPEHWDTIKIKYTSWLKGRIGWQGLTSDEYQDEGAYLITGTDFSEGRINWETCVHISEERFAEDEDIHIKEGDLLITKDGTIGKVAVAKDCPAEVSLNSGVMLIRNTGNFKYYDQYLYYTLLSDEFWNWYEMSQTGASTIRHLYQEQFYNFEFAFPPMEEQIQIAAYLDKKVDGINDSVKELQRTIEEYKSWKQSIIFKAVTQGIKQCDRYKKSSLDIVDVIPENWEEMRLKNVATVQRGGSPRPIEEYLTDAPDGLNWIKIGDTIKGKKYITSVKQRIKKEGLSKTRCVHKGDLLLTNSMSFGQPYILDIDGCIHDGWVCLADLKKIEKEYLYYFLCSQLCMTQFNLQVAGGVVQNLNVDKIGVTKIFVPPLLEQQEIVKYLDNMCEQIDSLILEKESLIEEMQVYTKALIFEVVTGKRKVV